LTKVRFNVKQRKRVILVSFPLGFPELTYLHPSRPPLPPREFSIDALKKPPTSPETAEAEKKMAARTPNSDFLYFRDMNQGER